MIPDHIVMLVSMLAHDRTILHSGRKEEEKTTQTTLTFNSSNLLPTYRPMSIFTSSANCLLEILLNFSLGLKNEAQPGSPLMFIILSFGPFNIHKFTSLHSFNIMIGEEEKYI